MALVEHLRLRGDLTAGFLIRAVANGKIDFFGTALVALSGKSEETGALASGFRARRRDRGDAAGLWPGGCHAWRRALCAEDLAGGRQRATPGRRAGSQLDNAKGNRSDPWPAGARATRMPNSLKLLREIHLDALRENARGHALAIAAA